MTNAIVYIGSFDTTLYAFDASTGVTLWTAVTGSYIQGRPVVSDGIVYLNSYTGSTFALAPQAGTTSCARRSGRHRPRRCIRT